MRKNYENIAAVHRSFAIDNKLGLGQCGDSEGALVSSNSYNKRSICAVLLTGSVIYKCGSFSLPYGRKLFCF